MIESLPQTSDLMLIPHRLTASGRVIEFGSNTRFEFWQFVPTRLESLGNSIPKVEINNSNRFLYLKSKFDPKNRFELSRLLFLVNFIIFSNN
jgi:hypothetical protein